LVGLRYPETSMQTPKQTFSLYLTGALHKWEPLNTRAFYQNRLKR